MRNDNRQFRISNLDSYLIFIPYIKSPDLAYISSLWEDRAGRLWVGTDRHVFHLDHDKPIKFTDQISIAAPAEFCVITQDRDGAMWFGSSKGLSRYANGQARVLTSRDDLPDNSITSFLQARDGRLWVGTRGGVAIISAQSLQAGMPALPGVLTERDGLASNYIRSLYEDDDGVIWIGSYDGGLTRYKDGKLTRYTMKDGLHSNGVFCILEDNHGWFWMNSNQGIYRVRRQELNDFAASQTKRLTSIAYNKQDGLLNIEGNGGRQPAGIKTSDGKLWFPMSQGVAVIDPDAVAINPLAPPVLIEDVQIDRQSVPNGIFQSAIRNLQSAITLSPGQTNLDIHYTGLSFINSAQVRFKYKLEGLDADWNEVGTRRAAYYSYLPPGEYTFRVTAANRDGVWNEESASVRIIVRPHFYQTWWFWSLVIAGLFGVTLLGFKLRVNQVERARALQEAFSRRLMDSQEQERQRIAAELHDSLGQSLLVIKNRAALAKLTSHDLPAAFQQLDQIADSTTHAIQEVRQIAYNLRPHHLDNIGLTRSLEELLRRVEETSGLGIAYDIAPLDGAFPKEAEINCYRIVQEAISNIIKHAQATRAGVEIEREPERLLLTIRDNGCGFVVQEPGERRGFGLARMAERARLLGGSYRVESAPGKGTTVVVELPLAKQEPKP